MTEHWIWPFPDGITDLTEEDLKLANPQLAGAAELWQHRKAELQEADSLTTFTERLNRLVAIETNVIERVFRLDRGITELLIEEGIRASLIPHGATDKPAQYVVDILQSALQAQQWMVDRFIRDKNPLTTFSIKELHQLLTQAQLTTEALSPTGQRMEVALVHGEWKKTDNQVRKEGMILRYCPPEHVQAQMDRLVEMHAQHLETDVAPEVAAAWVHHRLTQIHPFQDGNGRVARCIGGLVFLKAGLFPLVVLRDDVGKYIDALESADAGDLTALVEFFVRGQLQRFDQALNLAQDVVEQAGTLGLAIQGIGDRLKQREEERLAKQKELLTNADGLVSIAEEQMVTTAGQLVEQGLGAFATRNTDSNDFHYQGQAIGFAREHGYYADLGTYRGWARLKFDTSPHTQLLVHFHARGRDLGVIVGAAIFEIIQAPDDEGPALREQIDVTLEPFEFYSTESFDQIKARFRPWMNQTLTLALAQVQRLL